MTNRVAVDQVVSGDFGDLPAVAGILTRGHFRYESGHHGDLWIDLDSLFADAGEMRRCSAVLAARGSMCRPEVVCGPLTGGAFLAQFLAAELDAAFAFSERIAGVDGSADYTIPVSLRPRLFGRRVLFVDDAINAGSALVSTLEDAMRCSAVPVGVATLITLGEAAGRLAGSHGVPLFTLGSIERGMWLPDRCPLCAAGIPLADPGAAVKSDSRPRSPPAPP